MNEQRDFNPSRLELARRRRGMTKRDLVQAVGVSRRSLAGYSKGEHEPAPETIVRFAAVLRFPTDFFYGPSLEEATVEGSSFRALSTISSRLRNRAIAAGTIGISLADWIDAQFTLPEPDIPQFLNADAEAAAMEVRGRWNLGEQPIKNMIHLLELHGARVFSLAEDTLDVDAYSFWRGNAPFVFLNTRKSAERSRMDAAHELGHLVLHWKGGTRNSRQAETEAQQFGAAFLMPRGSVLARIPWGIGVNDIIGAKRYWIVSVANLTYRLHKVGLLSDHQYRMAFAEIGRRDFRRNEPQEARRERSQVLEKVFQFLHEKGVTNAQVAADLSVHPEELGKLLFGLVRFPMVIEDRSIPGDAS